MGRLLACKAAVSEMLPQVSGSRLCLLMCAECNPPSPISCRYGVRVNTISAGPLGSRAAKAIGFIDDMIR